MRLPVDRPALLRGLRALFSAENLLALLFCLILIALVILTADSAPLWIYQGF
ncbi:MAG TPA: hypothetical protein GYA06_05405 [Chloroflexi bacterium]|jgi:hypothetical protein|nr:hypothetical protein [Chloroflexota bacterium]